MTTATYTRESLLGAYRKILDIGVDAHIEEEWDCIEVEMRELMDLNSPRSAHTVIGWWDWPLKKTPAWFCRQLWKLMEEVIFCFHCGRDGAFFVCVGCEKHFCGRCYTHDDYCFECDKDD